VLLVYMKFKLVRCTDPAGLEWRWTWVGIETWLKSSQT